MAAMSRGPVAKLRAPKKPKGGTPSSRRHHFESFSQRIAKLKIEPVRRGRGAILDDAELDSTFSYFRDAFVEWRDLNVSETFTKFARQVAPLCDSLPQVLHHSERILDLLVEYIEKGDKHSEEPLLSLMAHFSHDLGVQFEQHFERAVRTVSQLAAKHPDVEVIEWSFTCLAWLFKYLSRLLVPDLRPVFDLMAPLLGKEHQKAFITRFAAESLSFLVRKAGAVYHRNSAPLNLIMRHISDQLNEVQGSGKDYEFQQGLMSLFADSMKGVQRGLHSSAVAILKEMWLQTYDAEYFHFRVPPLEPILLGVVTAIIHHSDPEHFQPLMELILTKIKDKASDPLYLGLSSRLLFVACGVRKGSRVADFGPVLDVMNLLLDNLDTQATPIPSNMQEFMSTTSIIFQYCPLDAAIPRVQILERLCRAPWDNHFLPFCELFAELGIDRFNTLLLPFFKRFVSQKAHEHEDNLCLVLPELYQNGIVSNSSPQPSNQWQDTVVEHCRQLTKGGEDAEIERLSYRCNSILVAIKALNFSEDNTQSISKHLYDALGHALTVKDHDSPRSTDILAAGNGFGFLVQQSEYQQPLLNQWPTLCSASAVYGHYLPFWNALLSLAAANKAVLGLEGFHTKLFKTSLMHLLGSPSHELRLAALSILEIIFSKDAKLLDIISTAMMIEQTPISLDTQRSISMRIGQLAKVYATISSDEWIGEAIPTYCFGLLHVKLASIWDDATSALKVICETKEGELHASRIAFEWLSQPDSQGFSGDRATDTTTPPRYAGEFECTNVMQLRQKISKQQTRLDYVQEQFKDRFDAENARVPFTNQFSRTQALRVLNELPSVAEKRSRLIVPVLLDWAIDQRDTDIADDDLTVAESDQEHTRWARKDQKAMLSVFSKFMNPKVLYRSTEVYHALLALLGNGDVEIQKAALRALLSWKEPTIAEYQENLFHLLDDARFRDEISVFLDVESEQNLVKEEHRNGLLPVLLRLLYGKVISGKKGLGVKRKAVFQALTRFEEPAIREFLSIATGPLSGIALLQDSSLNEEVLRSELMAPRKQFGMLNMLEDMLTTLKTAFKPFVRSIVDPVVYCLVSACRTLFKSSASPTTSSNENSDVQISMYRNIRQRSLHALTMLYETCPGFSWAPYSLVIVKEAVEPRLQQFAIETAQSVSGLLRMFSAWSKSRLTASFLTEFNPDVLPKLIECLGVPSARDEVKQFVLDNILRTLIALVRSDESDSLDDKLLRNKVQSDVLQPYANTILDNVGQLLRQSPSKEVLESGVQTVAELAPHIIGSVETRSVIEISAFLLKQPSKRVNAPTKAGLLTILHEFIPRCDGDDLTKRFGAIFDAVCPMFSSIQDRRSRTTLCDIIQDLSVCKDDLSVVASLCHNLNAFSSSRLDEPDFERRSDAFDTINEKDFNSFSVVQWKPLVFNMLYFIKDNEELSIRVNASLSLRRFIEISPKDETTDGLISTAILPGIQGGMRVSSELVRTEFLAVLVQLIEAYREWEPVADLHTLISEDEEASFYANILHIQGHRRLRALRRLASNCSQLQSRNIYHILLPLLEHFVFDKADDESANTLAGETIRTISALCQWLEWPQYRSLLKRYTSYLTSKEDMQKTTIKLLAGLMDSLNQAGRSKGYIQGAPNGSRARVPELPNEGDAMDIDDPIPTLAKTLPQQEKLTKDVINNVLPDLMEFLRKKDESTVSLRVPVGIAVTKVLLILPPTEVEARLPSVLLDICHILRSRSQDSRDMARTTLAEIATFAGPAYLGFILKALRIALQRGYQLHVLSFTLHSILVKLSEQLQPGDLDYCLADVVDVIMDDTFGLTGQEKDAEEYISKMKEVKSSKSFDTMDIIARSTTPSHLVDLVLPIKSLLTEKLNAKIVQKIDELLRRIGLGVLHNQAVKDRDVLVFCYELIQEVYKANDNREECQRVDPRNRKYLVNLKGAAKSGARHSTSSYIYKITRFSLDILRTVLRKHEELQTHQNLLGFLPILGDAMVAGQDEVQISAIRLLSTIIKVPIRELDDNCPVYVTEAVRAIKGSPSSSTEIAQASLKLITAILRERQNVEVKERDLAHLLKRILPDLDQPDRQGVTFGFLKAVMNRKIVIAEVYEVMDKVAAMMVTNQTRSARDLARSSYFHFLMEYPQAKNRFKKQLEFLLKNLRYEHVEGRQSVMEALNLVLTKVGDNVLQDELGTIFIPLIHSMANDDSADCRTMAGALVKKLFERADSQRLKTFTDDLRDWLDQDEDPGLKRLGIQCWGLYIEVADTKPKELALLLEHLQSTLEACLQQRDEDDWELIYYALAVFSKLCKASPELTFSSTQESFWVVIRSCVSYPHAWVKLTAAKLIGTYLADLARTNGDAGLGVVPLEGSQGLQLTEVDMIKLTNSFLKNLTMPNVSEDLCSQSVRNLAFLARCFAANGAMWKWQRVDDDDEVEDTPSDEESGVANGDAEAESSGEEWGGFSPEPESTTQKKTAAAPPSAINRLVVRLCGIIRRETKIMKLSSLYPKSATASLLETITTKLPVPALESSLPHLLTTLSTLTDPATTIPRSTDPTFNTTYHALIDKAQEILNILQKRMGTQEYLKAMSAVQRVVKQRREERRQKRKVEAVTEPEKWGKEKKRRNDIKRVKRKEKSAEYRGKRRGW